MAITVNKPTNLNAKNMPAGRYWFTNDSGTWEYVINGKWGKCKSMAVASYKRDKGSNFGTISAELLKD